MNENALFIKIKKYRFHLLVCCVLLNFFFAFKLKDLTIDNSLEVWFSKEDPSLEAYQAFKQEFGNDEVNIVTLQYPRKTEKPEALKQVSSLAHELQQHNGIDKVQSLLDLPLAFRNNQVLTVADFLDDSLDSQFLEERVSQLSAQKTMQRFFVDSLNCYILFIHMDTLTDIEALRGAIHDSINTALHKHIPADVEINQSGTGIIYQALNTETIEVVPRIMLMAYLVILLLIYLFTRKLRWVFITLGVIIFANITLFGIMVISGAKITMVTMAIPLLISVIGVANIIHFSRSLNYLHQKGEMMGILIFRPLLFNALTTAGGFASLATADMQVTSEYGIFAAAGVLIAFFYSLTLSISFAGNIPKPEKSPRWIKLLEKYIESIMLFAAINNRKVILAFLVLLVGFGWGFSKLKVDTNTLEFFPDHHPVLNQIDAIENQVGLFFPADFLLHYDSVNWKSEKYLLKVARFQEALDKNPQFGTSYSIADVLNDTYGLITGKIQTSALTISELSQQRILAIARTLQTSDIYSQLVGDGGRSIRVSLGGPFGSARNYTRLVEEIRTLGEETMGKSVSIEPAGTLPMYAQSIKLTLHDQLSSFALALVVVILLIGLLFKSVRLLLIAIPTNLIPILVIMGLMGFMHIKLDIANITIAAALLGIIVDDTIHLLYSYNRISQRERSAEIIIHQLAQHKGMALLFTSIILSAGFFTIGMAEIKSVARPGWLMAVSVLIALLTDLLLLPALLFFSQKHTRFHIKEYTT